MSQINLPKKTVAFDSTDPNSQNILIATMRAMGVPVYENTKCFDPKFPYIYWDRDHITQTKDASNKDIVCSTIEEFLSHFIKQNSKTIRLSDKYDAIVSGDEIEVGCQTIPFEKVREVYKAMLELRG